MMSSKSNVEKDIEGSAGHSLIINDTVRTLSWSSITVGVKDAKTKQHKTILDNISGVARAGEVVALMGPSGSGKTTLLNVLAHRQATTAAKVKGRISVNGAKPDLRTFRKMSAYVEQEDALIGSLTVRETLEFSARLALPSHYKADSRKNIVADLLQAFGLQEIANTIIGTPIKKGISGGQKRRVSVASQMVTSPRILFLDEPTSGLDSTASHKVISLIKQAARKYNLIIIVSIHQPATKTLNLFDNLVLLAQGKTCYHGPVSRLSTYFEAIGFPLPMQTNPAEFILDLINTDFSSRSPVAQAQLEQVHYSWSQSTESNKIVRNIRQINSGSSAAVEHHFTKEYNVWEQVGLLLTLLHRSFIKSYRDVTVYGIRIMMYSGLAIMMGTVWLRLDATQQNIQTYINAIFFGSAFMSFMAVAYVPAFLEDRAVFVKERANGLYGSTLFQIGNFILGLPWLFSFSLLFSVIAYWLINLRPTATAFFTWVFWVFLDLIAAESLVVLVASIIPNFVVALALTAFANGLWMSVGGFLVPPTTLNVFWKYVFHYIDYQAYVFQGMMVNEFAHRNYTCGADCNCGFQSRLASQCRVPGEAVLDQYGYAKNQTGTWVGILFGIVLGYRILGWAITYYRKT